MTHQQNSDDHNMGVGFGSPLYEETGGRFFPPYYNSLQEGMRVKWQHRPTVDIWFSG